ncbi:hypothetical protein [Arenibacter algicola]|uniref:hypothetical protein n=1 Tax=Arenibacter algicola TaxID=616991 RepID=UPI0004DF97C8|nr:hypothetical protein [Arenibacter algicola]
MEPYQYKWVQTENLSGPIWCSKNNRYMDVSKFFMGRERKVQAVFSPLVLLRGSEGVVQTWNEKTSRADRPSVFAGGGL